ncbi:MAG: hypothetical protein ABSA72_06505 [Nitrososphaerales archaeon]
MPSKTVTSTFRIDEEAFRALQEDAKKQNISVNTLVNQLFLGYAHYDSIMKRFQMVKIPGPTFKTILDGSSEEAVLKAARTAGESIGKTFLISKMGAFSVANILEGFRTTATYINAFEISEYSHAGSVTLTITHALGKNGTLFIREWVKTMFGELHIQPKFLPDEHAVIFEVPV